MPSCRLLDIATPVTGRDCHWGDIPRPRAAGRSLTTRVWICEYPYRTVRDHGPDGDCDGCPLLSRMAEQRAAIPARVADQIAELERMI